VLPKLRSYMKSLRFRILLIVLLCWLLPALALGGYMGGVFFGALQEKTEAALASSAEHAHTLTIQIIQRAITLAKDVTYDGELATAYADFNAGRLSYHDFYRISRNYLERKYGRESLFTFAAYFPINRPDTYMYTVAGYQDALGFQQNCQLLALDMGQTLDTKCSFAGWNGNLYLVRNLYNLRMERYGMLVLGMNMQELFAPLYSAGKKWDSGFDILLGGYESYQGEAVNWAGESLGLSERKENLSYVQGHTERDYTLYTRVQVNKKSVYAQMTQFRQLLLLLVLAIVPVGVITMLFVHRRIAKPIFLLSQASRRMADGELGVTVPMHGKDELGQLGIAFSSMSTQIRHLVDTAFKEEIALRDARIEAMQSRINPHFLNNALEMINWQARMDNNEAIAAMVEALSVLLNASLDRGDHRLVPLSEELSIADAYFYFVRLRFGDRLTIFKDVNPVLLDHKLPRMVIQTLLENAIEHGIAPAGGGRIRLNVFSDAAFLHVEVLNNGKQLTKDDREKITALIGEEGTGEGHVGIRNVSQRLRLIYRGRASLRITQDNHGDTVATIVIPLEKEANMVVPEVKESSDMALGV
jgi:two-component system, sensor histidine kinase YesM